MKKWVVLYDHPESDTYRAFEGEFDTLEEAERACEKVQDMSLGLASAWVEERVVSGAV